MGSLSEALRPRWRGSGVPWPRVQALAPPSASRVTVGRVFHSLSLSDHLQSEPAQSRRVFGAFGGGNTVSDSGGAVPACLGAADLQ